MTRASPKKTASRRSAGQKPGRNHLKQQWLGAQLGTHQPKQQAHPHSKADHHSPCHHHNPELIWELFWHGYLCHWALSGVEPSVLAKWRNSAAHGGMLRCRSSHWAASYHSYLSSPPAHESCLGLHVFDQREILHTAQNNVVAITVHTATHTCTEPCRRNL